MSLDGMAEWFGALPFFQQVFFGLFLVLTLIPFATLIIFQLFETLRGSLKSRGSEDDQDES